MTATMTSQLIDNSKIIICLGAGGVGKTTTAVTIALAAALSGKRTALLSIDPAKRLADAIGIVLGSTLKSVDIPDKPQLKLSAVMLDQQAVFDEMVMRFTKDSKVSERILQHPLYKASSANFGGAIEYMALAKTYQIMKDDSFDLIVLDTPPDAHALDFLSKPNILAGFMENKVMSWLIKPFYLAQKIGLGKVFAFGERFAGGIAEVTGIKALQNLAEYLVLMQDSLQGFHEAGQFLQGKLRLTTTNMLVITTAQYAPMQTAKDIAKQLQAMNFSLAGVVINRLIPAGVVSEIEQNPAAPAEKASKNWLWRMRRSVNEQQSSIRDFAEEMQKIQTKLIAYQYVEDKGEEVETLTGLLNLARQLT